MAIPGLSVSDYRWNGLSTLPEGSLLQHNVQELIRRINWPQVAARASRLRGGEQCQLEELIGLGGRHLVRILSFADGQRWVVRIRFPDTITNDNPQLADSLMLREVQCLQLVAQRTSIPVPSVKDYGGSDGEFGVPFIMMECLPGNCAMDLNFDSIPPSFKASFFQQMAAAQVQMSTLTFPMIGTINVQADGAINIGPIPGIGGPFQTASGFFRAWASAATFPMSEDRTREGSGSWADEIWRCTKDFPHEVGELADEICSQYYNEGPFPLLHPDFGHNNIVVDEAYKVLGVIDWEYAIAAPWQMVEMPLTVRVIPPPVDLPSNYDGNGTPINPKLQAKYADRDEYIQAVKEAEAQLNVRPTLSSILSDSNVQNIATAMKLFKVDGKIGFYSRVLDVYRGVPARRPVS